MLKKCGLILFAALLTVGIGCGKKEDKSPAKEETATKAVSFQQDLMPIFTRSCAVCHHRESHDKDAIANGVYYETPEDILGKVGIYILPGKPEESGLLAICAREMPVGKNQLLMPPPGSAAPKWKKKELEMFSLWIVAGAQAN